MQGAFRPLIVILVLVIATIAWRAYEVRHAATTPETPATEVQDSFDDEPMATWTFPGALPAEQITDKQARITTEKGDIVIALFPETAPLTVSNFVYLAQNGYFDGLTFHRRESWVLQGGDPTGTGAGGPGYTFEDELNDDREYNRGVVAMANRGANTNGSQFFIMVQPVPLDKAYSIFGEVIEGMDVVDQLSKGAVMEKVTIEDVK